MGKRKDGQRVYCPDCHSRMIRAGNYTSKKKGRMQVWRCPDCGTTKAKPLMESK